MNNKKQIYLFPSIKDTEKANLYEYLSVMVDGWVTIVDALDTFLDKVKNDYFAEKIRELKIFINSWDSFSKSMKKCLKYFQKQIQLL